MSEELYPDDLTAEEFATLKGDYDKEYEGLKASCLKADGTPKKNASQEDLDRLKYLEPFMSKIGETLGQGEPGQPDEVLPGDILKHYVEKEFYVVTANDGESVYYFPIKHYSYAAASTEPFDKMRSASTCIPLAHVVGNLASGKWSKVDNVAHAW